jgi:hypothetical protein
VFKHFKPDEYKEGVNYKHVDGDIFNNHISNIKQSNKEDLRVIKKRQSASLQSKPSSVEETESVMQTSYLEEIESLQSKPSSIEETEDKQEV